MCTYICTFMFQFSMGVGDQVCLSFDKSSVATFVVVGIISDWRERGPDAGVTADGWWGFLFGESSVVLNQTIRQLCCHPGYSVEIATLKSRHK